MCFSLGIEEGGCMCVVLGIEEGGCMCFALGIERWVYVLCIRD